MKNKRPAFIVTLIGVSLLTTSCQWFNQNNPEKYSGSYNPYRIISNNDYPAEITLDHAHKTYTDVDEAVRKTILAIGDNFTYVKSNGASVEKGFRYYLPSHGLFLLINRGADFFFYEDGYVDVKPLSSGDNIKEHYYYQFDKEKASSLYEYVTNYTIERDQIEKDMQETEEEYKAKLDSLHISTLTGVVDDVKEVTFFPQTYGDISRKLTFDETFKDLIKNARYEATDYRYDQYRQTWSNSNNNQLSYSYDLGEKDSLTYKIDEGLQLVMIGRNMTDKYGRFYDRYYLYRVNREDVKAIFDYAIALYEAKNSSSSSANN